MPEDLKRPRRAERERSTGLKVPFARCGDGVARHVAAVENRAMGPFHCLDCGEALALRRPSKRRPHFTHRPDSNCAGETALHRYAKELLAREKKLTVPELRLSEDGVVEIVCPAGEHVFESVSIEQAIDAFQPDAIAHLKTARLAVEFCVTHAVDAIKTAKVINGDISMLEIDLSKIRAGRLDDAALDHAVLHTAPRKWIHHRRQGEAAESLRTQVEAKRRVRGKRLAAHIGRKGAAVAPPNWRDDAMDAVREAVLDAHVGVDVAGSHWFGVTPRIWQAAALDVFVIQPSQTFSPGAELSVKGKWPNERDLSSALPAWMIRSDLSQYGLDRLQEAGFDKARFATPHAAIWNYLEELAKCGLLQRKPGAFFVIAPGLHGMLHRRARMRRSVIALLQAAEHPDPERAFSTWASSPGFEGQTPAKLIDTGGERHDALASRIRAIEKMSRGNGRDITGDLCGLPLDRIRDHHIARIAAEDEARTRKEEETGRQRRRRLQSLAEQALGDASANWLAGTVGDAGIAMLDWAEQSDANFAHSERRLWKEVDDREKRLAAEQQVAGLRAKLTAAAEHAFRDPEKARVFLNAAHPGLRGDRPLAFCNSEPALALLLRLLPKR
ncbi:hypothetical protein U91I_03434 [alpha proteobacterium U9-1i]|nr:hypothetical protein U91I_03434 [alpha proteobacterium U9-1i]